ncbi:mlo-like protein 12 [Quercus suber]|uniref:Mlo-like protein 12 n=1 Tax=Quercus suber TaxID=58331 RepID=A0AAW0KL33_QUESU
MGFISLLLIVLQKPITNICIPKSVGATWHPCKKGDKSSSAYSDSQNEGRKLLQILDSDFGSRRMLAVKVIDKCTTKMRKWKVWEDETKTLEYQHSNVTKVDYLTLRHGFIMVILLVGTKLLVIITKMGLSIQDRGAVVRGAPVVQLGDDLFWFGRPKFILFLIHLVLFQNAFQLAFFAWSTYEFGLRNCFHRRTADLVVRISMGVVIQFLCSYVTLPLYALVTQMGSTMKPTIFNDKVATALKNWHRTAKKNTKHNHHSESTTPFSSRPATPTHGMSPVHLLHNYHHSSLDSTHASPTRFNVENDHSDIEDVPSPSNKSGPNENHFSRHSELQERSAIQDPSPMQLPSAPEPICTQHEINIGSSDFSFSK